MFVETNVKNKIIFSHDLAGPSLFWSIMLNN